MEELSKAYNEELRKNGFSDGILFEDAVCVIEKQISIIDYYIYARKITSPSLNYLRSLKETSLKLFEPYLKKQSTIPDYSKQKLPPCNDSLLKLQIDLFVILDKISLDGKDINNIMLIETRALGLIK